MLYNYHNAVMVELALARGCYISSEWLRPTYRGKHLPEADIADILDVTIPSAKNSYPVYPEHDDKYLEECLLNLKAKGAKLENGASIEEWLIKLNLGMSGKQIADEAAMKHRKEAGSRLCKTVTIV